MNDRITTALTRLDAHPAMTSGDTARRCSEARLKQILTTPTASHGVHRSRRYGRAVRRTAIGISAAAAATAGILIVAGPSGGDSAYASWTATPSPLTASDRTVAVNACVPAVQNDPDSRALHPDHPWTEIASDRRGDWVTVALGSTAMDDKAGDLLISSCLVDLPAGRSNPIAVQLNGAQGASLIQLNPAQIEAATISITGDLHTTDAVFCNGQIGDDVKAVQIILPTSQKVDATVSNGQYFAWWPSSADRRHGQLSYRVTLTNGTILTNAIRTQISPRR